jgi:hypothetical protein
LVLEELRAFALKKSSTFMSLHQSVPTVPVHSMGHNIGKGAETHLLRT